MPFAIIKRPLSPSRSLSPLELARSLHCSSLMHTPVRAATPSPFIFFAGVSTPVAVYPFCLCLHPHLTRFLVHSATDRKQSVHSKSLPVWLSGRRPRRPPSSSLSLPFRPLFRLLLRLLPLSPASSSLLFPDHALVNFHTSEPGTFLLSRLAPSKREKRLSGLWGYRRATVTTPPAIFPTGLLLVYANNRTSAHRRRFLFSAVKVARKPLEGREFALSARFANKRRGEIGSLYPAAVRFDPRQDFAVISRAGTDSAEV